MSISLSNAPTGLNDDVSILSEQIPCRFRRGKNFANGLAGKHLVVLPFLLLAACGNSTLSCSDPDSKKLLKQSLTENYTNVFGQFAYIVEPGTVEAQLSAITTLSSDIRSANCSAHASLTYQNRKVTDPKAQSDIDGAVALIGARNFGVSYEIHKTDDGQLELRISELQ